MIFGKEQLDAAIKAIQDKAESEIKLLKDKYILAQKVDCEISTLGVCTLFKCDTKEQLKKVLEAFPANETGENNPLYGYDKHPYPYPYQIGVDNNMRDIIGRINYVNESIGKVWIQFNTDIIDEHLTRSHRSPSSSEDHYYGGVSRKEMEKIKIPTKIFTTTNRNYYGGDVKLGDAAEAKTIIEKIKS